MQNSLFTTIKTALHPRLETVLGDLLPGGRVQGREYVCGSVGGGAGDSCKTNLRTGVGSDFATDEKWGDVIALTALVMRCGQEETARFLADEYHIDTDAPRKLARRPRATTKLDKATFVPVMPISDSAPDFPGQYRNVPHWCYRNADGMELCYTFRRDRPDGKKDFVPLCFASAPNGSLQWVEMVPPSPRLLYGLDKLASMPPNTPILLVEGEKTADAAQRLLSKYVCMTWSGGGNAVVLTDYSPIAGRSVVIWPNNDSPGIKAAAELSGILHGHGAEMRFLYPPDCLPKKWDLADTVPCPNPSTQDSAHGAA